MTEERQVDVQAATDGIRQFLNAWGIDLEKTGMADTPMRVVEAYGEFFSGLNRTDEDLWKNPIQTDTTGIVALRNLEYYSLCEHHLLPFFGTVSIAYLPKNGKIAGFGRFADAVAVYARRPQLQERMTEELCRSIEKALIRRGSGHGPGQTFMPFYAQSSGRKVGDYDRCRTRSSGSREFLI